MGEKAIVMFPTWLEARIFMERYGEFYESAKAGIGIAECAARTAKTISQRKPGILILAGFAGAYRDRGIAKGETVLVERENSTDLGTLRSGEFFPLSKSSDDPADNYYTCRTELPDLFPRVVSNTVNLGAINHRNHLLMDGQIENMEGAAFFAVCNAMHTRFMEVRTISNIVDERPEDWITPQAGLLLAESVHRLLKTIS